CARCGATTTWERPARWTSTCGGCARSSAKRTRRSRPSSAPATSGSEARAERCAAMTAAVFGVLAAVALASVLVVRWRRHARAAARLAVMIGRVAEGDVPGAALDAGDPVLEP